MSGEWIMVKRGYKVRDPERTPVCQCGEMFVCVKKHGVVTIGGYPTTQVKTEKSDLWGCRKSRFWNFWLHDKTIPYGGWDIYGLIEGAEEGKQ